MASDDARGFLEIGQAPVRAGANERDVDPRAGDARPCRESHERERFVGVIEIVNAIHVPMVT